MKKRAWTTATTLATLLALGLIFTMARKGGRWLSKEIVEDAGSGVDQWTMQKQWTTQSIANQLADGGKVPIEEMLRGLGEETLAVAQEQRKEETGFGEFDYSVGVVARLDKDMDTLMQLSCAGGETLRGLISQSEPMRSSYSEEIEVRLDDEATEAISVEITERFFVGWQRRVQQEVSHAPAMAKCVREQDHLTHETGLIRDIETAVRRQHSHTNWP